MNRPQFPLVVDRTRPLEEVIAAGGYGSDIVNLDINSQNFPAVRTETIGDCTLVHFDANLMSDEMLAKLDELGLRAADTFELATFGEKHPEEQRKYPILALGQKWQDSDGCWVVAYLGYWGGERGLNLGWFDRGWGRRCCVLAFSK